MIGIWLGFLCALGIESGGFTPVARAQNFLELAGLSPDTRYKQLETPHFRFVFEDGYEPFTRKAAAAFEHAHTILQPILKWQPRDKTTVLISDNEDAANGFALPSLRVGMVLIATPPDAWFSTSYSEDWIKLLVFHEYTHFLNIDPTNGFMEFMRIAFGDVIRPNGLWPMWMLEGLATYFETRTSRLGRGRSPYYEGILRSLVNEGRLESSHPRAITLDRVNGETPYFPGGEVPYLFGYHLWNQFVKDTGKANLKNSEDQMGELSIHASSRIPYFINDHLSSVKGRTWSEYWKRFVAESKARFSRQIQDIKKSGETPFETVATSDYSVIGGVFSPDGNWVAYTESSLEDRARLILKSLQTGKKYRLEEKLLGAGMAFTPDSRFLVFSALYRMKSYQLYSELFAYDLSNGQIHEISSGLRAKDPAISPDGKTLAFLRTRKGSQTLEVADWTIQQGVPRLKNFRTLVRPQEFSILSGPAFQGSGEILYTEQSLGSGQSDLKSVTLKGGQSRVLLADGAMNRFPAIHGGKIHFISNQSGIENVHVLEGKRSVQLTHCIGGAAFPSFSMSGELHSNLLTSDGYQLVKWVLPASPIKPASFAMPDAPEPIQEALGPSPPLGPESATLLPYSAWSTLAPRQWAPIAAFSYDQVSGASISGFLLGFDATGKHQYTLTGAYNTLPRTVDGAFSYTYSGMRPLIDLSVSRNTLTITPTDYRNHLDAVLTLSYPIFWVRSTLRPSLFVFGSRYRIEQTGTGTPLDVPDFQYRNPIVPGFGGALVFSDARKTRLGFTSEIGNDLRFQIESRFNTSQDLLGRYLFSWTHHESPGANHVIRTRARWMGTTRASDTALTTSKVAGKDLDSVFDRGTGTSLSQLSFRGYPALSANVRHAGSVGIEYHLPLIRSFRGPGTIPAFIKQTHGFLFADANFAEDISVSGRRYSSLLMPAWGLGIGTDTQLLLRAPIRLNVEFQNGTRTEALGESRLFFTLEADSLF
jgi:Tol biopolymer transport system component